MAQACPSGRSHLTEVFRSRESKLFFSAGFPAMCVQTQPVCLRRACPSCRAGLLLIDRVFSFARERCFSLRDFSRCAYRRSLSAGAGLPLRPGQALPFLTKRKEAKIRQRGEFRFSPPWNSLSTTKGSAFGNREKLPLWFLLTHRHSLRVKQVRKESFHVCKWYQSTLQVNKACDEAVPKNSEPTRAL